jgi:hypothetical protein
VDAVACARRSADDRVAEGERAAARTGERGQARHRRQQQLRDRRAFHDHGRAASARRTLGDSGYPSTPREVATREFDGYWVYLESPPTEAGERRLLDRLKRAASRRAGRG